VFICVNLWLKKLPDFIRRWAQIHTDLFRRETETFAIKRRCTEVEPQGMGEAGGRTTGLWRQAALLTGGDYSCFFRMAALARLRSEASTRQARLPLRLPRSGELVFAAI
jgi:hypothetical protein